MIEQELLDNGCVKLSFEGVFCFINPQTKEVFSAKFKKLAPLKHKRTNIPYYIICYNRLRITKSYAQLEKMISERNI